jgi:hypothetical protein
MSITALTTGVQTLTGAGTVTGSADISAMTEAKTISFEVTNMTAGTARIEVQDSVDAFTGHLVLAVIHVVGPITSAAPQKFTVRKEDMASNRFGTPSAVARLAITALSASTISLNGWIEN